MRSAQHILRSNMEIPKHIAFIMDGNGRWANARGLKRSKGHEAGVNALDKIIQYCYDLHIENITFYAFSTENWKRPTEEVSKLMQILTRYLGVMMDRFDNDKNELYRHTKVRFIGDLGVLSPLQKNKMNRIMNRSDQVQHRMTLNIAVNYGGRDEIVNAVNAFIKKNPGKKITKQNISDLLYTAGQPDADLIIRTGGEMRLSNFLMWQSAYSEYYTTPVLWPDFDEKQLDLAIHEYNKRTRKFGGLIQNGEDQA